MTSGDEYRRRAAILGKMLGHLGNRSARAKFKNKQCALLEQADNQDWLDGKTVLSGGANRPQLPDVEVERLAERMTDNTASKL
jgi:hypothetical protein